MIVAVVCIHDYDFIAILHSERPRGVIGELNCVETLIRIVQEYDITSKQ